MAPQQVAVKVMKTKIPGPVDHMTGEAKMLPVPPAWRANFQAEAILMRALRHENVVRCYGLVDTGDDSRAPPRADERA
eukprot:2653748-Prymnesium_polylepis.1